MAAPMPPEACPLCGLEIETGGQTCRPSCPMSAGCILVCCPRCSYSFPSERFGLARILRRIFQSRQRRRGR